MVRKAQCEAALTAAISAHQEAQTGSEIGLGSQPSTTRLLWLGSTSKGQLLRTVTPSGDHVFKHRSPRGTFYI